MGWEFGKTHILGPFQPWQGFILETWEDENLNTNIKNRKNHLTPKNIHSGYQAQVINKTQISLL